MSGDGPTKLAPPTRPPEGGGHRAAASQNPEPLDDIILGEDEATDPVPPRGSKKVPPAPRTEPLVSVSSVAPSTSNESKERKRAKMTLRIPDDEVSRPALPAATPAVLPPVIDDLDNGPRLTPTRIIAVGPAADTIELPPDSDDDGRSTGEPRRAIGIDSSQEKGWTPYGPPVADGTAAHRDAADTPPDGVPSIPVSSDDIPVELEDGARASNPGDDGDRVTDPGDVSEVEPEDLVSVESIPVRQQLADTVSTPSPIAGSMMTASQPQVLAVPLASGSSLVKDTHPNKADRTPVPPASTEVDASERAPTPLVFMPQVGALAPPPMNETAAHRKKTRPWWEDLFNDDYIRTMAKIADAEIAREVTFIEESLGCEAGAMILDLACGTGRHAIDLAARGYQVCGFDLSLSMLARASDEAQDRKQRVNFVQGDMRDITFEETFDGVYCWNTSFGYFDEEKNNAVVARVHRALKKGGQFLLDVINRDYIVRQAPSLAWFEGDGCICMDEMQIDFITSRMKVKRTLMMDDGRTKEIEYSIRIYSIHELGKMLHDNGFRVAEVSGRTGTPGVFFGCESPRTLILAEKR